jgi:hypothetical protein
MQLFIKMKGRANFTNYTFIIISAITMQLFIKMKGPANFTNYTFIIISARLANVRLFVWCEFDG